MNEERGQVGGLEGLIFGVLIFVFGTLVLVNAWQVVDAKFAAAVAAREAARSYVESSSEAAASENAQRAALAAIAGRDRTPERTTVVRLDGVFARCSRITMEVRYRAPLIRIPVLGALGADVTVSARHSEVIDPMRSGLGAREAVCAGP